MHKHSVHDKNINTNLYYSYRKKILQKKRGKRLWHVKTEKSLKFIEKNRLYKLRKY